MTNVSMSLAHMLYDMTVLLGTLTFMFDSNDDGADDNDDDDYNDNYQISFIY